MESLLHRIEVCHEKCNYFRKHGRCYHAKHLHSCADAVRDKGDYKKEQEILNIIWWEKDQSFWRRMNYSMGRREGNLLEECLWRTHIGRGNYWSTTHNIQCRRRYWPRQRRYARCRFAGFFGYNLDTETARAILAGTYDYPEHFDQATKELCQECACLREIIPENSIDTVITTVRWKSQWRGRKESMSSSESGLHFGHYIAGAS